MKKSLFAGIFVLLFSGTALAHPPTDLELKYDVGTKTLTVHMRHVSADTREHYLRTISVSVNGQEPQSYRYTHQPYPAYVEVALPVDAKIGDILHVIAKCIQGGSVAGDLLIIGDDQHPEQAKDSVTSITGAGPVPTEKIVTPKNPAKKMP